MNDLMPDRGDYDKYLLELNPQTDEGQEDDSYDMWREEQMWEED